MACVSRAPATSRRLPWPQKLPRALDTITTLVWWADRQTDKMTVSQGNLSFKRRACQGTERKEQLWMGAGGGGDSRSGKTPREGCVQAGF